MTWSIVVHDPATNAFAVAVATKAFAVGASCPFVRSGVGAVSTQSMTNRYLGPAVLDGMARGLDPASAIQGALAGDGGAGLRQVHAVDRHGRTAAWTGRNCVEWCGNVAANGISVAGNMLAGQATIDETLAAWEANDHVSLTERLMLAMEAGEAAGGDRRGGGRGQSVVQAVDLDRHRMQLVHRLLTRCLFRGDLQLRERELHFQRRDTPPQR